MEILCSLIVPVYNEEKNIYKCLEVIDSQNYDELEVIFVNDGSTDNSKNIL
ncbi:glycosyltransferase family 2 protein, partial [Acinetobacter nosocomialis]|uniref:glycosyltransferase family 2 protein n=1 Tax=Acinetobacter nosocomialis TaxID=106654 RepID=UPI001C07E03A